MIDHALLQLVQDAIASNLEPTITVIVGGAAWRGRIISPEEWANSVRSEGIPSNQSGSLDGEHGRHLRAECLHLRNAYQVIVGGASAGKSILRLRLDDINGWWLDSTQKAKIEVL